MTLILAKPPNKEPGHTHLWSYLFQKGPGEPELLILEWLCFSLLNTLIPILMLKLVNKKWTHKTLDTPPSTLIKADLQVHSLCLPLALSGCFSLPLFCMAFRTCESSCYLEFLVRFSWSASYNHSKTKRAGPATTLVPVEEISVEASY